MSRHIPKVTLMDILGAIEQLQVYTAGITYQQYIDNNMLRDAVYRNVMVLGDATTRLPDSFMVEHADIEWHKMISTRNALAHGYDKIDDRIVWNIIQYILPGLKLQLQNLADSL